MVQEMRREWSISCLLWMWKFGIKRPCWRAINNCLWHRGSHTSSGDDVGTLEVGVQRIEDQWRTIFPIGSMDCSAASKKGRWDFYSREGSLDLRVVVRERIETHHAIGALFVSSRTYRFTFKSRRVRGAGNLSVKFRTTLAMLKPGPRRRLHSSHDSHC
jgi:hypothetical protein